MGAASSLADWRGQQIQDLARTAEGTTVTYSYDSYGNPTQITTSKVIDDSTETSTVTSTYDMLDRELSYTEDGITSTYVYDAAGRINMMPLRMDSITQHRRTLITTPAWATAIHMTIIGQNWYEDLLTIK